MRALVLLALLFTGCACHRVKADPPVRVKASRCHAIVDGVTCLDGTDRYVTLCSCTGDV